MAKRKKLNIKGQWIDNYYIIEETELEHWKCIHKNNIDQEINSYKLEDVKILKFCTNEQCDHPLKKPNKTNFNTDNSRLDKLVKWCKECKHNHVQTNKKRIYADKKKKYEEAKKNGNTHQQKNKEKVRIYNQQYNKENFEKNSQRQKEYHTSLSKYDTYSNQIDWIEDTRNDPENSELLHVRCNKCKNWFNPTNRQIRSRISAINGKLEGECRLYCSDLCKDLCPVFKKKHFTKDQKPPNKSLSYELSIWRQKVIERFIEKNGKVFCEYCENENIDELIVHHIKPQKLYPHEAFDIDNGLICCGKNSKNRCHYKYGHVGDECNMGSLSNIICL